MDAKWEEYQDVFKDMRILILSPFMHLEGRWVECVIDMMGYSWAHGLSIFEIGKTERMVVDWERNNRS